MRKSFGNAPEALSQNERAHGRSWPHLPGVLWSIIGKQEGVGTCRDRRQVPAQAESAWSAGQCKVLPGMRQVRDGSVSVIRYPTRRQEACIVQTLQEKIVSAGFGGLSGRWIIEALGGMEGPLWEVPALPGKVCAGGTRRRLWHFPKKCPAYGVKREDADFKGEELC